jgi:hypothetical protein
MAKGDSREGWKSKEMAIQILVLVLLVVGVPDPSIFAEPQDVAKTGDKAVASQPVRSRVTIEVGGGEKNEPVENASVYLKYVEERKLKKDKTTELNVKTNRDGTAHVPDTPTGRVLIQVIADGWKTYGRWYDISDANQTIKVHLEKPPKWY